MAISNEELLRKATLTSSDFGGAGEAPLSIEQVKEFIRLMAADQVFLSDVRRVTSSAAKWTESIIDFGGRITHGGTQGVRLADADRAKPQTGSIEMSTVLLRAEVPVADEALEDNVGEQGFANDLEVLIADQFGFDVEELLVNGDTNSADPFLALLDGWLKQAKGPTGHVVDGSTFGQDYQSIFHSLLGRIPNRHKRNLKRDGRFYVPVSLEENYRDILSARGTPLGDLSLEGDRDLKYQGIPLKGAPSLEVDEEQDSTDVFLTNRQNLYAGFRRSMTMETYRDPREGATSFIVTARVDAKVAIPDATAIAEDVDVTI